MNNPTATTISAATAFSGTPTISQLALNSFATIANIADLATFATLISTSAFVGTLTFYGLEVDGASLVPISAHLRNSATIANNTAINTAVALNQVWVGSIATFKAFYVVCTAFTSGSVSVQPGLSAASYAVSVSNTILSNISQVNGAALSGSNPVPTDGAAQQGPIAVAVTSPLTANQDNSITFASKVRTVLLHNQSAVNVPYDHDQAASAVSPYLAPGQMIVVDIHTTVLHVFPSNALPVNAASGLIVRGWN